MTKQRIKVPLAPAITSREEAEAAMNSLALAANNRRKFIARADAEKLAVDAKFAPNIEACNQAIEQQKTALCQWAEANPAAFGKKKSIDFAAGTLGFRTGTPKLSLLNRSWTWDKVLTALREHALFNRFIRTKQEVDKEAIITSAVTSPSTNWASVGVKMVQDESFYVEPNLTDTEEKA
jgi:phage host-nuclease inhibitor protein Gam